jgi:hypothetical protein
VLTDCATRERYSELRELAAGREIRVLADLRGTPTTELLHDCPCDGLNLITDDVEKLAEVVQPFHRDYSGTTLREHLSLRRPRSQFAAERAA